MINFLKSLIATALLSFGPLLAVENAAGPEAWPMFRGTPSGAGRSTVVLQLPLSERWNRRFEGGAFTATPVIF